MAILGINGFNLPIPVSGGGLEYGYTRNINQPHLQNGTTINTVPISEATQRQGNEGLLDDYTKIMGNQDIVKSMLTVKSNANLGTCTIELRHSEDLVSWATQIEIFSVPTVTTGIFTNEDTHSMNDEEYYLFRGQSAPSTGQMWANTHFKIEVK